MWQNGWVRFLASLILLVCARAAQAQVAPQAVPVTPGAIDGTWFWQLPTTPSGTRPYVSWHATASAPSGDIYVAGMDHVTNSALFRLVPGAGTLRWVGDARTASQAADNWQDGETAEKFHTRPTFHLNKVYVATMDYSPLDDGYLERRGFHWYAYTPATNVFEDLNASEPGGVGWPHVSVVNIASAPVQNMLYGVTVPTAELLRYDVAAGRTTDLGRPAAYDRPYVYAGRFMWVDATGRLYFSAGNASWHPSPPAIYGFVRSWDQARGFRDQTTWKLRAARAIELGQCATDRTMCTLADDQSRIYRYRTTGTRWTYLGQAMPGVDRAWVFDVSADGNKVYLINSPHDASQPADALYEYDIPSRTSRHIIDIAALDPRLTAFDWHTGYNAWDKQGRFYFVSFPSPSSPKYRTQNAIVTAIDPVRLKKALGL